MDENNKIDMLPSTVTYDNGRLCYCGQACKRIPETLTKLYENKVDSLDLSYNELITLRGLDAFSSEIKELILDNNQLGDSILLPELPKLHTLSLNKNKINDLEPFLIQIRQKLPRIKFLSLLGNKACPNQLSGEENDDEDYQRYRYFVLYHLPNLQFLDSNKVYSRERLEAKNRGQFMNVVRPKKFPSDANHLTSQERELNYTPLPKALRNAEDVKGVYAKCRYRYTGKHSEGNRFICNKDL